MAECENCIHQYVCEKRTCAECVGGYCDECELYCQYDGKPDIKNCKDFINSNDVVPVVRCKDCKHYKDSTQVKGFKKCAYSSTTETDFLVMPDDFCNYGERNE